ncbi:hypothetical protein BJ980_000291 [Nocardioides daedukensis]|uniref:Uncharacterized protein n=1 Tax=Nocardioides daedukensis TaxID=634462 RepID=A0A7Y9RZI0_9ACTN|nr:DUF6297 family protein [Nocardioides daedukensis]NYG57368.1 hypothetical protein [Nocardioides daedukensis]
MRHWRRAHVTRPLSDIVSDGYVAIFSVLMLGSMLVSVLLGVAALSDELCTSTACRQGRSLLPHLTTTGALVAVLALARMFGPVFATPATSSWLLTTTADRGALLRPRLWGWAVLAAIAAGLLAAAATLLGGFGTPAMLGYSVFAAVLATAVVALAGLSQASPRWPARSLTWALAGLVWLVLLLLALERAPLLATPASVATPAMAAGAVTGVLTVALLVLALRRVARLRRRDVAAGGSLAPGLSGAMATLDLALMYDVLLGHRWRAKGSVTPRRGGPSGVGALVWADVLRLRRSPRWVVLIAASVVVPYAVGVTGAERIVFLVGALVGFVTCLPLLASLRVLSRSSSVLRNFPFPVPRTRAAALVVPLVLLALHGLATIPVLHSALGLRWDEAAACGIASGLCALAAATRWVTGRPPDFGRPLVSSPAGGVPTNLYGSILRGFDILLLTAAPVLLAPGTTAAMVSVTLSVIVLAVLTGRE